MSVDVRCNTEAVTMNARVTADVSKQSASWWKAKRKVGDGDERVNSVKVESMPRSQSWMKQSRV